MQIGGNATSPFALSQHFMHSISLSPFPPNAGKRASKFTSWLDKREMDMMEEEIHLPADLQCGDIFHLCALISLGQLSITPYLPEDGIGEAEDSRTSKRKNDSSAFCGDKSKRLKTSISGEGEIVSRREKGFPGIRLALSRMTVPRMCTLELFKDKDGIGVSLSCEEDQNNFPGLQSGCTSSHSDECNSLKKVKDNWGIDHAAAAANKSPWESMTSYAEHLISSFYNEERSSPFHPELFRTICSAIQKSGDQGLSMEEVSRVLNIAGNHMFGSMFEFKLTEVLELQNIWKLIRSTCSGLGDKELEIVVDVLEAFGRALKVCLIDFILLALFYMNTHPYNFFFYIFLLLESNCFLLPVKDVLHLIGICV